MSGATRRWMVFGGAAAVVGAFQLAPRLLDRLDAGFEFTPLDSPPGFRRLAGEGAAISTPQAGLFVGLDQPVVAPVAVDLCVDLFAAPGGGVPVAAFSDYYCPYCRILDARVQALADEGLIALRHHEVPLLGEGSDWAARGAIAARRLGQGQAYFDRMLGTRVRANPAFLREVARDIGIDPAVFEAEMGSAATQGALDRAAALHRLFGFLGTPALVVGRTVLQGAVSETQLRQLISLEREQTRQTPCA